MRLVSGLDVSMVGRIRPPDKQLDELIAVPSDQRRDQPRAVIGKATIERRSSAGRSA